MLYDVMLVEGGRDLVGGVWRGCGEVGGHQRSRSSHTPSHSLPTTDTSHQYGATGCSQAASAGHRHQAEIRDTIKILETTIRDQSSLQTSSRNQRHHPEIRDILQRPETSPRDKIHPLQTRDIIRRSEKPCRDQKHPPVIRGIFQRSKT